MNYLRTIARDAKGIAVTCGWGVSLRWLWQVGRRRRERTDDPLSSAIRRADSSWTAIFW